MATKAVVLDFGSCTPIVDPASGVNSTQLVLVVCVATTGEPDQLPQYSIIILPTDSSAVIRQKMLDIIRVNVLADFGKTIANEDIIIPAISTGLATPSSETRTDTFTTVGNGVTVDTSLRPLSVFAVTVESRNGILTSWDIRLEGSLDGTNWTQILQHTNVDPGDKQTKFSGTNRNPSLFFRSRCVGLVLGTALAAKVTILGIP